MRYKWIIQIAQGMLHIHTEGILHCDLAARNVSSISTTDAIFFKIYRKQVMLDGDLNAKISDFGLSISADKQHESDDVFPLKWMSVEGELCTTTRSWVRFSSLTIFLFQIHRIKIYQQFNTTLSRPKVMSLLLA